MDEAALDTLIDAGSELTGIGIKSHWRPSVRMHLSVNLALTATLMTMDLPDDIDPAPVFQA